MALKSSAPSSPATPHASYMWVTLMTFPQASIPPFLVCLHFTLLPWVFLHPHSLFFFSVLLPIILPGTSVGGLLLKYFKQVEGSWPDM